MEVFDPKNRRRAYESEAYAVLSLLKIGTVQAFAKLAGINHCTAGEVLGVFEMRYHKKHGVLIRVHETLHSTFMDQRLNLSKKARAFIVDWAKRWQVVALDDLLWNSSPGKEKPTTTPSEARRMAKRRQAVKAAVKAAFERLEWR